jgi:UPF0755 protein
VQGAGLKPEHIIGQLVVEKIFRIRPGGRQYTQMRERGNHAFIGVRIVAGRRFAAQEIQPVNVRVSHEIRAGKKGQLSYRSDYRGGRKNSLLPEGRTVKMTVIKKIMVVLVLAVLGAGVALIYWAHDPLMPQDAPTLEFTVAQGSSMRSALRQAHAAGVPASPLLMELLARGLSTRSVKPGSYRLKPGTTPLTLLSALSRGDTIKESITIIEGWTFAQMRAEIARHPWLKHDSEALNQDEWLARVLPGYGHPEGLFYPDTYVFDRGTSDLQIYRLAHQQQLKKLDMAWASRAPDLPYTSPYEALIMASIVEKETGREQDRTRVASVFVNRLRQGMRLQTDPTVIYGMGERFDGNLRKRDLQEDTAYNTYQRSGLPPTPIALPGQASMNASLHPNTGNDLYFVARGDGSSEFSSNLDDHNRAVNKFQRHR